MPTEYNDPKTFEIIGAAMEVHRALGALTFELLRRDTPFARAVGFGVRYKGDLLPVRYRADFVCYDDIVVEIKALPTISGREYRQLKNYLGVSEKPLGLLLNFGAQSLQYRRVERRFRRFESPESPESPSEG